MNKYELISAIANQTKIKKTIIKEILSSMCDNIVETLKIDESVILTGFGTFTIKHRKERMGRNPQNGQKMLIPASKLPGFKVSKIFKDKIKK